MQLVHCITLTRGSRERLTYFATFDIPVGSLVSVPVRSKKVRSLVVGIEEFRDQRLTLKRASWSMRKIPRQKPTLLHLPAFIEAAKKAAELSLQNLGATLAALTPKAIVERAKQPNIRAADIPASDTRNQKSVFQAPPADRITAYRSLIREEFARGKSVFLLVPTVAHGEWLESNLSRGIPHATVLLHGGLSGKELTARWDRGITALHPLLIIATGMFLSLPRADLGTIIVECESSSSYRTIATPRFDLRTIAESLSHTLHARLILADFPLSVETLWRFRHGELDELSSLKLRLDSGPRTRVIDMRKKTEGGSLEILGPELQAHLEQGGRTFLFCGRRGIAPSTLCQDCRSTAVCNSCGAPVTLHKAPPGKGVSENIFFCHRCKTMRSAKERCAYCRSWKLVSLGIGIERVAEELRLRYPSRLLLRLDRDAVTTHTQAGAVAKKFYEEPKGILLGTELALHYLHEPMQTTAVVSLDSLLLVPEWRITEKIFSLLVALRGLAKESCIVQTRRPDDPIIIAAVDGNIVDFYAAEVKLREQFRYPPFVTLVKVTSRAPRAQAATQFERLQPLLAPYELEFFETRGKKEGPRLHGLLRIPYAAWPDHKLAGLLGALPLQFSVTVNPENIFTS